MVDAWNRRNLEVLPVLVHPEAEYVNSPTAVEPGTRRGYDEITAVFQTQWEILLDARQEIERIYDYGDEIFVLGRFFSFECLKARLGSMLDSSLPSPFTKGRSRVSAPSLLAPPKCKKPSKPWGCRSKTGAPKSSSPSPGRTSRRPRPGTASRTKPGAASCAGRRSCRRCVSRCWRAPFRSVQRPPARAHDELADAGRARHRRRVCGANRS